MENYNLKLHNKLQRGHVLHFPEGVTDSFIFGKLNVTKSLNLQYNINHMLLIFLRKLRFDKQTEKLKTNQTKPVLIYFLSFRFIKTKSNKKNRFRCDLYQSDQIAYFKIHKIHVIFRRYVIRYFKVMKL